MHPTVPELLVEWDRCRREGTPVRLEDLCAGRPDDLAELRERARRLEECDRLLGLTGPSPGPADPDGPVPARIGAYEIQGVLGRGGMGVVYRGWDPGLKRAAAVKVLRPTAAYRPFVRPEELRARFDRELEVLGRLDHEHLVPVYGSGLSDGRPYLSMALVAGGSARDRAEELTRRGPRAVAEFVAKAALGVHAAHALGVLHRDLKPSNILLTATGDPRVVDFGLARFWSPGGRPDADSDETWVYGEPPDAPPAELTLPGVQPGTPAYMAPEQFDPSRGPVGPATDVWALGVVLFELLSGRRPFTVADDSPLVKQVCRGPTPRCRSPHGRVPGWLRAVVNRCLAKDPADRYATAAELAEALRSGLRRGRRRAWAIGVAGVLALAVTAGIVGGAILRPDPGTGAVAVAMTPFEDLPDVRQELADLAERKEVVFVDGQKRAPYRWLFGPDTGREVEGEADGLTLHTKWSGPAAAEFLPSLPPGRYRVRAEVRHDDGNNFTKVALYVAGQYWESAAGRHLQCLALHFADVGPEAAKPPTPPGISTAAFGPLLTGEVRAERSHWDHTEAGKRPFVAAAAAGRPPEFRTMEFEVTGAGVRGWWDQQPVGLTTRQFAAEALDQNRAAYPELVPGAGNRDPIWGGVGILVFNGTVTVRRFRIDPLQ